MAENNLDDINSKLEESINSSEELLKSMSIDIGAKDNKKYK